MQQGDIRLLLTSSLIPDHPISRYVITHGDGVADVAMRVKDVDWTYKEAVRRGAKGIQAPKILKDDNGTIRGAAIAAYGDTVHTFIERHDYHGIFAPGYVPFQGKAEPVGLKHVDHVVANVEEGKMDSRVKFYANVSGSSPLLSFDNKLFATDTSTIGTKATDTPTGPSRY